MKFKETPTKEIKDDTKNSKNKSKKNNNSFKMSTNTTTFIQRMSYLLNLVQDKSRRRSIIFFNTKLECHKALIILNNYNISAKELHSDIHQTERIETLDKFQKNQVHFLLATDVVGRGIDVDKVKNVINFFFSGSKR